MNYKYKVGEIVWYNHRRSITGYIIRDYIKYTDTYSQAIVTAISLDTRNGSIYRREDKVAESFLKTCYKSKHLELLYL